MDDNGERGDFVNSLLSVFRKRKEGFLETGKPLVVTMQLEAGQMTKQAKLIGLSEEDLQVLRRMKPIIASHLPDMVDKFYRKLLEVPLLESIIFRHSSPERLIGKLIHI